MFYINRDDEMYYINHDEIYYINHDEMYYINNNEMYYQSISAMIMKCITSTKMIKCQYISLTCVYINHDKMEIYIEIKY